MIVLIEVVLCRRQKHKEIAVNSSENLKEVIVDHLPEELDLLGKFFVWLHVFLDTPENGFTWMSSYDLSLAIVAGLVLFVLGQAWFSESVFLIKSYPVVGMFCALLTALAGIFIFTGAILGVFCRGASACRTRLP